MGSVVLANSDLIDKLGVVLFPSIPLRAPVVRSWANGREAAIMPNKRSNSSYSIGWICFTHDVGAQVRGSGSSLRASGASGRWRFNARLQGFVIVVQCFGELEPVAAGDAPYSDSG